MQTAAYIHLLIATLTMQHGSVDLKEYSHVSSTDGVELYEKWIETGSGNEVREVLVTMKSNGTIGALVRALGNETLFQTWHKGLAECNISDHRGNAWKVYLQYSTPWPLSNQECLIQYRVAQRTGQKLRIDFYSLDKADLPGSKRVDRVLGVQGSWEATLGPDGQIQIVYRILSARSTSVPTWVSDPFVRKNTINSFIALRELLQSN